MGDEDAPAAGQPAADRLARFRSDLEALDAKDVGRCGAFLADGVEVRFGNGDPAVGKASVLPMLAGCRRSFGTLEHDLLNIYGTDATFVPEALNHYTRIDGTPAAVRAVAFTDRGAGGLVTAVRVYADTAPLFAAG